MNRRAFLTGLAAAPLLPLAIGQPATVTVTIPTKPTLNVPRLLRCIADIETGNNDRKIGRRGERSRYQIREMVWRQHAPDFPFRMCHGDLAENVGWCHLDWLRKNLGTQSPYWLYFGWNAGLSRTKAAMKDPCVLWMYHGPASRLHNLYYA